MLVERVQRAAEREHHVVRHVDDVRDRPHPGRREPRLHPGRRRADRDVAEGATEVARAALEVLDTDVHGLLGGARGVDPRHRSELGARQRRDLARDPVDRLQVGAVEPGLDLEHVLPQREQVVERRSRGPLRGQDEDPGVVGAELELPLGEDHPLGELAAELRRLEPHAVGKHRAGQCDRDRVAGAEVPGAADDLARLALPHVHPAELEAIGVRVLVGSDDEPDAEEPEVAVGVLNPATDDAIDLAAGDG